MDSGDGKLPMAAVLMSVYSGEKYIDEQIASILGQKGVEIRLLIRDDGSPDGASLLKIEDWRRRHPELIDIIRGDNVGFAKSFHLLVKAGIEKYPEARYFAFSDQDDYWLPDKLRRGIDHVMSVENGEDIPIAYASNTTLVDESLHGDKLRWNPEKVKISPARAIVQNYATGCTMVFNRKAAELFCAGAGNEIFAHDFRMYQMCNFLGRFIWDGESRILYRQHQSNVIGRQGPMGRMKKRLHNIKTRGTLENQVRELYGSYGIMMDEDKKKLVSRFLNYKKKWQSKLWLLANRKISYDNMESDFFYRLKILLNKV